MATVVCGDGWKQDVCCRDGVQTGMILKLVAGIGVVMGMRVVRMVGNGYKYLFLCSSLVQMLFSLHVSGF